MSGTSPSKATIINIDKGDSVVVTCLFNPKEYAFAKQNSWARSTKKGSNVPPLEFSGGQPATLTVQLFFDTYEGAAGTKDVRKEYTDAIWELMMVDDKLKDAKTKKSRPPKVRFVWGAAWSFDAVITSLTQRFTLFAADGTPVRATMDVTFQQIKDAKLFPAQNPTSGGVGGERQWTVRAGDTLTGIAYAEYGDPNAWRRIADANRLTQVRRLRPGIVLEIPHG